MNDRDGTYIETNSRQFNKKTVHIPLSSSTSTDGDGYITGELTMPPKPIALIIFAHGSGSGMDSPRNRHVAQVLNKNGFATMLSDLLTPEEQESDIKSQRIMGKYPGIVLNKFNIHLLSQRLSAITRWVTNNVSEIKDLQIGYFGSSTGAAAAIEASVPYDLSDIIYAIVSRGGRPDLAYSDNVKSVRAATLLMVGAKDSKDVIDINKKALKQLKNTKSKELVMVPNAGHLFEEEGAIDKVAELATQWFSRTLIF